MAKVQKAAGTATPGDTLWPLATPENREELFLKLAAALQLELLEGSEFTMLGDGFERTDITGVIGMQAYVKFEGNLCCYRRRALGQLSGLTA